MKSYTQLLIPEICYASAADHLPSLAVWLVCVTVFWICCSSAFSNVNWNHFWLTFSWAAEIVMNISVRTYSEHVLADHNLQYRSDDNLCNCQSSSGDNQSQLNTSNVFLGGDFLLLLITLFIVFQSVLTPSTYTLYACHKHHMQHHCIW